MYKPFLKFRNWAVTVAFCGLLACNSETTQQTEEPAADAEVTAASDWETLSIDAWRNYRQDTLSSLWAETDGVLELTAGGGGDIITREQYENFELELEWKISEAGNSGVFFRVIEADDLNAVYYSGPEMQILDNEGHGDAAIPTHRAGDNYDMQSSSVETVKPVGEWNHARLVVNGSQVEHWLNGTQIVTYNFDSDEWAEQLANSKFKDWPNYAKHKKGHIALQDHGDRVWFRNIRIREL